MKHVVVGTAGHIDHGKTELVKALTGVNTDRFKEEQERGITIDIGFAPLAIGGEAGTAPITLGFVDVPGHEKFVKNMLAGVWGIDLVLLVIAADESIKPQTREHFDICRLLTVKSGVIALTKVDLVDPDLAELATLEIRDFVRGSFLEEAPIIPVSARTRVGLDRLVEALAVAAARIEPGRPSSLLRLPVDRSFSIKGFGTVVTGTLVSGAVSPGDEVKVYPAGRPCRVRGLQVHGQEVARADAGQRTAVNLQGIDASQVERGDVLSRPGQIAPSSLLDVRLALLPSAPAPLKDLGRVRFHQGTCELLARVKLLDVPELAPGHEAFAQIRLERPSCCLPGDRFVIRRYSPTATIGGGVVLDAHPVKHRGRAQATVTGALARLEGLDPREALRVLLSGAPSGAASGDVAVRLGITPEELDRLLDGTWVERDVLKASESTSSPFLISIGAARELEAKVTAALTSYHRQNPLRAGMPREELRERALKGVGPEVTRFVIDRLAVAGAIRAQKDTLSLASHQVTLSPEDERTMQRLEEAFKHDGLNPPALEDLVAAAGMDAQRAGRVFHLLLASGRLVRIKDGKVFHAEAIERLKSRLWELRPAKNVIDIGSFKELTGTSRKNAIPLLEHLDSVHVTRRVGSDREILPPPGG
ncbi:MAG TPA: selenocysteine-specific translation elongation factor [Candidatus Polarisedimenticolia bacterium]|nr:selenocysteine-specific translation elongation factor [Candidatus Polarisedimenticolia bacterium]